MVLVISWEEAQFQPHSAQSITWMLSFGVGLLVTMSIICSSGGGGDVVSVQRCATHGAFEIFACIAYMYYMCIASYSLNNLLIPSGRVAIHLLSGTADIDKNFPVCERFVVEYFLSFCL